MEHARRSRGALLAIAVTAASLVAARASAQLAPHGDVVVLTGPAHVARGDAVRTLVVLRGPARVDGLVTGDVVALGGDVDVAGTVGGDVVALAGAVRLEPGATVHEDVFSPMPPSIASGARIVGERRPAGGPMLDPIALSAMWWLATTASLLALALMLAALVPRRAAEAMYDEAQRTPARALGLGLLVLLAVPALAWLAALTLLGIPLAIVLVFALAVSSACGYVGTAWLLGRAVTRGRGPARGEARWSPLVSLLFGLAILRLVAMVPLADLVAWIGASAFGLGAALVAIHRARRAPIAPGAARAPVAARPAIASPVPPLAHDAPA